MEYIVKGVRLNKNGLENLKIDDCPVCKHPTLQAKLADSIWHTCLMCGNVLKLEYIARVGLG